MKTRPKALALAVALFGALAASPGAAFDLGDLFDAEDQARARAHNVLADNAEVVGHAPPVVVMTDFGSITRRTTCIAGADCSKRPVTTGNYFRATETAPWLIYQSYIGHVRTDTGLHEKGDATAFNTVEVPANGIRPGGLHIRSFGAGVLMQTIRK